MVTGQSCSFVEALEDWGHHEIPGLLKDYVHELPEHLRQEGGTRLAVEALLRFRPGLVLLILAAQPHASFRASLEPGDVPRMRSFDNRSATDYTDFMMADPDPGHGGHVRRLVESPNEVSGPILCVAQGSIEQASAGLLSPIGVFDGNHRMAAWIARVRKGMQSSITANLVLTRSPIRLMPRVGQ